MCSPAPVVLQFGRDAERRFGIPTVYGRPGPGGEYLGSVGDQAHSTRRSSHNCASAPGGQESPVNGVSYAGQYAHAWDCRPATRAIGEDLCAATIADARTRYVIYDNTIRYPSGRRSGTSHPTFHVSFLPGTHADIRPFFAAQETLTVADIKTLTDKLDRIDRKVPGLEQQKRDRARIKAIGSLLRAIKEGRPIDEKILAAIESD
jgi:hypothetical protein